MTIYFKWWQLGLINLVLSGLFFIINNPLITLAIWLIWLLANSLAWGNYWHYSASSAYKILTGMLAWLAISGSLGAIFIYFYKLLPGQILLLAIFFILASLYLLYKKPLKISFDIKQYHFNSLNVLLEFIFLGLVGSALLLIKNNASADLITNLWSLVPLQSMYLLVFAFIIYIILAWRTTNRLFFINASILFLPLVGLAAIIYKLGYGFDPFIHLATEKIIINTGTIDPKPLYYLGQYSLISQLHYLTGLPLFFLNQWLVPLLYAIFVPGIIFFTFLRNFSTKIKIINILPLAALLVPLTSFIYTTPQSLANLMVAIIVFVSFDFIFDEKSSPFLIWSLTIFSLLIHPLAGVPAGLFVGFLYIKKWLQKKKVQHFWQKAVFWELFIVGLLTLPALFVLNSKLSNHAIKITLQKFPSFIQWWQNTTGYLSFVSFYDFTYWLSTSFSLIMIVMLMVAVIYIWRQKRFDYFVDHLTIFLILIINYFVFKNWLQFDFLISYEKLNYTVRLLELAWLIILPLILITFYQLWLKAWQKDKLHLIMLATLTIIFISLSVYTSYPRRDAYVFNKSLNTTQYDFSAVKMIAENASADYVVLANQAVSAAALAEYGFANYYNNHFYYPLPTSGPLYQKYLDLAYQKKPVNEVLKEVKQLTGLSNIYFVINNYWSGYEDIVKYHQSKASNWQKINNSIYIFYYQLANNSDQ